jgi:hypothetical protein
MNDHAPLPSDDRDDIFEDYEGSGIGRAPVPSDEKLAAFRAALYRSIADLSAGGSAINVVGAIEDFSRAVALQEFVGIIERAKQKEQARE